MNCCCDKSITPNAYPLKQALQLATKSAFIGYMGGYLRAA